VCVATVTTAYYVVARDRFSNLQNSGVERFVIGMQLEQTDDPTATGRPTSAASQSSAYSRLTGTTGSSKRRSSELRRLQGMQGGINNRTTSSMHQSNVDVEMTAELIGDGKYRVAFHPLVRP